MGFRGCGGGAYARTANAPEIEILSVLSHCNHPDKVLVQQGRSGGIFDSELLAPLLLAASEPLFFRCGASLSASECGHYLDTFFTAGEPLTAA